MYMKNPKRKVAQRDNKNIIVPVLCILNEKRNIDVKVTDAQVMESDIPGLIRIQGTFYRRQKYPVKKSVKTYGFLWWRFFLKKVKTEEYNSYFDCEYLWTKQGYCDISIAVADVYINHNEKSLKNQSENQIVSIPQNKD
jgi:hypothetical protein